MIHEYNLFALVLPSSSTSTPRLILTCSLRIQSYLLTSLRRKPSAMPSLGKFLFLYSQVFCAYLSLRTRNELNGEQVVRKAIQHAQMLYLSPSVGSELFEDSYLCFFFFFFNLCNLSCELSEIESWIYHLYY